MRTCSVAGESTKPSPPLFREVTRSMTAREAKRYMRTPSLCLPVVRERHERQVSQCVGTARWAADYSELPPYLRQCVTILLSE
jgi:hypothetical protein